jgi:hypothetical protein
MANEQKTPLARTLPLFATQIARDEINKTGLALPGHVEAVNGPIVTVSFDVANANLKQVTMPVFGPEYIRYPIQKGDRGVAFPVNVSIAHISGLGTTDTAPSFRSRIGNLGALVWFPIGNKNWSSMDPNSLTLYAPPGGTVTIVMGMHKVEVSETDIMIDGHSFLNHTHIGVTSGGEISGGVNPAGP